MKSKVKKKKILQTSKCPEKYAFSRIIVNVKCITPKPLNEEEETKITEKYKSHTVVHGAIYKNTP